MNEKNLTGETIVWITGATSGIGEALAETVPYQDARVISIARRLHPTLDSLQADIAEAASWDAISEHLAKELSSFAGRRALFIHNAFVSDPVGFVGEVDPIAYRRHILANAAAPLIIGDAFFRHLPAGVEGGLVMVSSAAARVPFAGRAGYGGGKAAMEQWVKTVRVELAAPRYQGSAQARELDEAIEEFIRDTIVAGLHELPG